MFNSQITVLSENEIQLYLLLLFESAYFPERGKVRRDPSGDRIEASLRGTAGSGQVGLVAPSPCLSGLGKHWPRRLQSGQMVTRADAVGGAGRGLLKSVRGLPPHTISQEHTL